MSDPAPHRLEPRGLSISSDDLARRMTPKIKEAASKVGSMRRAIRAVYGLPFVGYIARLVIGLACLPRYLDQLQRVVQKSEEQGRRNDLQVTQTDEAARLRADIDATSSKLHAALDRFLGELRRFESTEPKNLEALRCTVEPIGELLLRLIRSLSDAHRASNDLGALSTVDPGSTRPREHQVAAGPEFESFYFSLQERFRGSSKLIAERLGVYVPHLEKARTTSGRTGALDLGCGRGEFLDVAAKAGLVPRGVDQNAIAVRKARASGFEVVHGDALATLADVDSDSLAVVSAVHLVEHLPFALFAQLLSEANRALASGGLLVLETPNPENLSVGAHSFWLDPTHRAPVPPLLAQHLCEFQGFTRVEILRLHPDPVKFTPDDPLMVELTEAFHGPSDYAVLAWA